jgi:hypothetical protein
MAGLIANSVSVVMVSGDTLPEQTWDGFLVDEMVTLAVTPAGTSYSWGMSLPNGASSVRASLSSTTAAAPTFTPDTAGEWVLTCLVNGITTYVMRLGVTSVATMTFAQVARLQAVADSAVSNPSGTTLALYNSATHGIVVKTSAGVIYTINKTVVP